MSQSDDIAEQIRELYIGPPGSDIQIYLDSHPLSAAQTFISITGAPGPTWDSDDTAGVGKEFGIGFFVQDSATGALYRCYDAAPGAAVWRLVIQEEI